MEANLLGSDNKNGLESLTLDNINNNNNQENNNNDIKIRKLSCISSSSSNITTDTVVYKHGKIRNKYPKKIRPSIPYCHKIIIACCLAVCLLCTVWFVYGTADKNKGLFFGASEGAEEETDENAEHEKKVDWTDRDIAGFCVAACLICVAAGGGIGGGGVLVPTYIFVLGFSPKFAIPLSNCTILGSSISNLVLNVNKRHPFADRPCIDWDMMLMMEPLTIAGALLGTFINVLSPAWLITIFLVILLVGTAISTLKKGMRKYQKETIALQKQAEKEALGMDGMGGGNKTGYTQLPHDVISEDAKSVLRWDTDDVRKWWQESLPPACQNHIDIIDDCKIDGEDLVQFDPSMFEEFDVKKMVVHKIMRAVKLLRLSVGLKDHQYNSAFNKDGNTSAMNHDDYDGNDQRMIKAKQDGNQALVEIYEGERFHVPWKVAIMFLTTGGILILNILKGGGDINPLNIECGGGLYWVLTIVIFPFVAIICYIARTHLVKMFYEKDAAGYEYLEEDVQWNERNTIRYPLICSVAGLCAGMFGIGGGIVKGPLMLEMGVLPNVASATSATMILFTSSGACVSYLLFNQLNLNYGMILFCLGMCFTLIGQKTLNVIVAYYKRNSLIILVIGVTVAASAVAMSIQSSGALIDLFEGKSEEAGDICGAGGE